MGVLDEAVHARTVDLLVRQSVRLRQEYQECSHRKATLQSALYWIEKGEMGAKQGKRQRARGDFDIEQLRQRLDGGLDINARDTEPDDYALRANNDAPPVGRSWADDMDAEFLAAHPEEEESEHKRSELAKKVSEELRRIARAPSDAIVTQLQGTRLIHSMLHALRNYFYEPESGGGRKKLMEWTSYQQAGHMAMIASRLTFIYGSSDYQRHREAIHRYWNIPLDHPTYVCIMIPRRHGKSVMQSDFDAVCLYFLPGDRILLLTIGDRVSSNTMKEYIIPRFRGLPDADSMIVTVNSEKFSVQSVGSEPGVVSNLYAHPMGGQTRGFNARYVVNDEAAFGTQAQFTNNIGPHLQLKDSAFLAISSPPDDDAHQFAAWAEAKDDDTGRPLFRSLIVRSMCSDCVAKKLDECPHAHTLDPPYEPPPWITEEKRKKLRKLYQNDSAAFRREIHGIIESDHQRVFERPLLEHTFSPQNRFSFG
jgi:hypothetical protein